MPYNRHHYAFLIGITDYESLNKLPGAENDAKELFQWLTDQEKGGGLPQENCLLFTSDKNTLEPSFLNIYSSIVKLIAELKKDKSVKDRRFYFFFSGHGFGPDSDYEDVIICLSNWSDLFRNMGFEFKQIKNYIASSGTFSEIVLLLDCCRSRKIKVSGLPLPEVIKPNPISLQTITGYATKAYNPAFEAEMSGGGSIDDTQSVIHGHFSRALLDVLNNRQEPKNGVPADEVKSHVEKYTPIFSTAEKNSPVQEARVILDIASTYSFMIGGELGPDQPEEMINESASLVLYDFIIKTDDLVEVSVYDDSGRELYTGVEGKLLSLPAGNYTLITKFAGVREKQQINHPSQQDYTELKLKQPQVFSAAIISGAETTHEYYSGDTHQASFEHTHKPLDVAAQAGLFFMLRMSNDRFAKEQDIQEFTFSLLNESLDKLASFEEENSLINTQAGSLIFSIELSPGQYYLSCNSDPLRFIPVFVYPNWQTYVFITFHHRPLFEGMRVMLGRFGEPYSQQEEDHALVDIATHLLSQPMAAIPRALITRLGENDWNDPMLGLIGAKLLLRQASVDKLLLDFVVDQTRALLGINSPDLEALHLLAVDHLPHFNRNFTFDHPPMLDESLDGVIEKSLKKKEILPSASLISKVSPRLCNDSPFTAWNEDPFIPNVSGMMGMGGRSKSIFTRTKESFNLDGPSIFQSSKKEEKPNLDSYDPSLLTSLVLNAMVMEEKTMTLESLAKQLRLPPTTIQHILETFSSMDPALFRLFIAQELGLEIPLSKVKHLLGLGSGEANTSNEEVILVN